jgi:predicted dienelactone hydrolase
VLNQLEAWNAAKTNHLAGRLDLKKVGMSGHSFGAVTTEAVGGQTLPVGGQKFIDPRIKAALVLSPSAPRAGSAATAFGAVKIPWLLMTGTKDLAPIGNADLKSRLAVYPALHGAPKYELVLHNAEHSVFTDRALPGAQSQSPSCDPCAVHGVLGRLPARRCRGARLAEWRRASFRHGTRRPVAAFGPLTAKPHYWMRSFALAYG